MSLDWQKVFDPTTLIQAIVGTAVVAVLGLIGSWGLPRIWRGARTGVGGFVTKEVRRHLFIVDRYRAADGQTRLEFQNYIAMRIWNKRLSSLTEIPFLFFGFTGLSIAHGQLPYVLLFSAVLVFGIALAAGNVWKLSQLQMLQEELFESVQLILSREAFEDSERQRSATNSGETQS